MAEPEPSSSFPKGLRVLAVDGDKVALHILQQMLLSCNYQVTICERGKDALSIIREDRDRFDLVLCDVHVLEIDGFTLLRVIKSETDIPVVMMSSDDSSEVVAKGVINGACDFLVKPICIEQIRVIWQHVLRRRLKVKINGEMLEYKSNYAEDMSIVNIGPSTKKLEEKQNEDEEEENEGSAEYGTRAKKPRIIWTTELHHKFIQAVHQLGADKAVPKRILECMQGMGVTKLTRENVASHLQKFRLNVRRMSGESVEHSGNFSPFVGPNGFEQSSSSAHQFQFGEKIATALQEQRDLLGPGTSHSGQAHNIVSTNLGFGLNKEQPLLGQPVQMAPIGLEIQNGAAPFYGHENVGVTHHMFMQNNYSLYDGAILTQQNLVASENSCIPFIQNNIIGELSSGQDSYNEVHLFAYKYAQDHELH